MDYKISGQVVEKQDFQDAQAFFKERGVSLNPESNEITAAQFKKGMDVDDNGIIEGKDNEVLLKQIGVKAASQHSRLLKLVHTNSAANPLKSPSVITLIDSSSFFSAREVTLPNLRSRRSATQAWRLVKDGIEAFIADQDQQLGVFKSTWKLSIHLRAIDPRWILESAKTSSTAAVLSNTLTANQGEVELQVEAPNMCPISKQRTTVDLTVKLRRGTAVKEIILPVDDECLLGDFLPSFKAQDVLPLAEKAQSNPTIDLLVRDMEGVPLVSVEEEINDLKTLIRFDPKRHIQSDPSDRVSGFTTGIAYALSPTETLRFGGDCEDWSILSSAYLVRRGYEVELVTAPGHIWVRARIPGAQTFTDVDFLGRMTLIEEPDHAPVKKIR